MYITVKEEFKKGRFDFDKNTNCPITNISGNTYYFLYPNNNSDFISTSYLEELKDYIEVKNEMLCNHSFDSREEVFGVVVCSECDELVKIL